MEGKEGREEKERMEYKERMKDKERKKFKRSKLLRASFKAIPEGLLGELVELVPSPATRFSGVQPPIGTPHLLLLMGLLGECRGSKSRDLFRVTQAILAQTSSPSNLLRSDIKL